MRQALDRHHAILDAVIAAHDGILFKTIGDAVQAAFPDAPSAVAAAVDAQRSLYAESWTGTGPVRARMAIHVGEAAPSPGERPDYLAPALNRLARLLAAGHGGQTLLTHAARVLVGGTVPEGVRVQDMGTHRLRDLLEAEPIWQLVIPGLPDVFPPLKTLERHPTNLPPQPTALIGRDALLADLIPVVMDSSTRLLTLTGPGGVGKTHLVLQLAADALPAFPDGAFFVDLTSVTEAESVLSEIAGVLGVQEGGGLSLREALIALLGPKRMLLILDNLEQLRPIAILGREIAELLDAAPGLTILATSRTPLRIRAEQEWPIEPLAAPDPAQRLTPAALADIPAVALLVERARSVKPSFTLTEANAADVSAIVRMLDGLPLAIELAASRLRVLSPSQLRDRLGQHLDLLVGRERDRPNRHQTLRATIDWSHNLLEAEQQALFRWLSVFVGGFSFEEAEGVVHERGEPVLDVLDGVDVLVTESLLHTQETADGELRYQMLATVRAYASEQLTASGEAPAARDAHLSRFIAWAENTGAGLREADRSSALDRLDVEYANLQAALTWAIEASRPDDGLMLAGRMWKFWQYRSRFTEGRRWLDRLLKATGDEPTEERMVGLEAAGVLAWNQGDLAEAEALLERALAIATEQGDKAGQGRSLNNLGNVRNLMGDLNRAAALFGESLELARTLGDRQQEALLLNNLALIDMDRGDLDTAKARLEESLMLKQRLGIRAETGIVLGNLAMIASMRGDLEQAIALMEEGLAIEREVGTPAGTADALGNLAQVLAEAGQVDRSIALHRESLILRRDLDDWLSMPYSLEGIGSVGILAGQAAAGVRLFAASDALREATGAPVPESDRPQHEEILERAKAQLGDKAFAVHWQEGQELRRDAAVSAAFALCEALIADLATNDRPGAP
jgi:predicted ATPase/Flp pilus assembly protein TadD